MFTLPQPTDPAVLREQVADVLSREYDGQPLAEQRPEHARLHLEAADAVIRALLEP